MKPLEIIIIQVLNWSRRNLCRVYSGQNEEKRDKSRFGNDKFSCFQEPQDFFLLLEGKICAHWRQFLFTQEELSWEKTKTS
jgi:hypothetical protein